MPALQSCALGSGPAPTGKTQHRTLTPSNAASGRQPPLTRGRRPLAAKGSSERAESRCPCAPGCEVPPRLEAACLGLISVRLSRDDNGQTQGLRMSGITPRPSRTQKGGPLGGTEPAGLIVIDLYPAWRERAFQYQTTLTLTRHLFGAWSPVHRLGGCGDVAMVWVSISM